jgi:feruloyl esterase
MRRHLLLSLFLAAARLAAAATCEDLALLKLPAVTITSAADVPAGTAGQTRLPAYCQAKGYVTTPGLHGEPANQVRFEVDLPGTGWNGKLYFAGGGGFVAGRSNKNVMAQGYASAYTDAGHENPSAFDATWAGNSLTRKVDFFYRGIHVATVAAKAITREYYAKPLRKAYFVGCSTGGRQAMMEAQRFPEDYDGIVAGAPAVDFTGLMLEFSWNQRALLASAASYIPATKLPLIAKAVLAECDSRDGLADGLIGDPRQCKFDPATIQCKAGESADCLTAPQVDTLRKLYAGPSTSSGRQIFPGMPIGNEDSPNYATYVFGNTPPTATPAGPLTYTGDYIKDSTVAALEFEFQEQFLRYEGFRAGNPAYDWRTFNFDKDLAKVAELAKLHNALNPDLSRFQKRGGKLILYNGWSDPVVPPVRIIQYYEGVESVMGAERTRSFARLFLAPGMNHCGGGPGPNSMDSLGALERWVEQGAAPDQIVASHSTNRVVDRTRPLCPYPQVAKWKGAGSIDDAANFACANP